MVADIPENQWHDIDEDIFANRKIVAIKQIAAVAGCGLLEAREMLLVRYNTLRASAPHRFGCNDQDYWGGYYPPSGAED